MAPDQVVGRRCRRLALRRPNTWNGPVRQDVRAVGGGGPGAREPRPCPIGLLKRVPGRCQSPVGVIDGDPVDAGAVLARTTLCTIVSTKQAASSTAPSAFLAVAVETAIARAISPQNRS